MKIAGAVLIILGLIATGFAFFALPWLAALACDMNTTGCKFTGSFLVQAMTKPDLAWMFWLLVLLGGALMVWGASLTRPKRPSGGN